MKKLIFFISLILFGCVSKEPKLKIINNSPISYDTIKIFSNADKPFLLTNVKPNKVLKGKILFDEMDQSDGAYIIELIKQGDVERQKSFGYYTNGGALNRKFIITIEQDTIKIIQK
ncbi:hypothetical protein GM418_16770 [Maribellus comscasis]|uniref:Lipoprotein n=1 Tax=Maribellus comscasis TaxID=2681766 RepID=A0A6I6K5I5_9BACT|nr:hypothetical protein [Maribellus comscasis]QGY45264.1 hypothetical protein GM418_16770 [Maribellus comscasis]